MLKSIAQVRMCTGKEMRVEHMFVLVEGLLLSIVELGNLVQPITKKQPSQHFGEECIGTKCKASPQLQRLLIV